MKKQYENVASSGMDVHYKFSNVTFRNLDGQVVARGKLDHKDQEKLKQRLSQWLAGLPVVMEALFAWAMAASASRNRPPSEKLSGVTFRMPITTARPVRCEFRMSSNVADIMRF